MVRMDSGLGSDEEQRRTRTKEQKQRHNEQLLNGAHCFIDASTLQDEDVSSTSDVVELRKTEERRQGALLFKTSIPQYSTMLQLAAGPSSNPPDTPFNSIVHVDDGQYEDGSSNAEEAGAKHSLGFYVDLNEVEIETTSCETSISATKNIFSMVIDFEAPKKEMPTRLRNASRHKQVAIKKQDSVNRTEETVQISQQQLDDSFVAEEEASEIVQILDDTYSISTEVTSDKSNDSSTKFVRLSDLMHQIPRQEDQCSDFSGPRMSRSIPESSWVENSLLMSRSAGYRIAPRPIEPDSSSLTDSTGSQTGASQRRLGTDLLRMFLEEIDTDTVLHVGTPPRSIKAHRCILISRCQYFAGTLRGRSLTIDGFSYEAIHFALCHIYSGAAHVPDSISLVELASLADMLSLEGLKEVVAHSLKSRHCHHFHSPCAGCLTGVLEVLPLSAAYGLDELYQRCLRWITSNYLRVWPSRAFASLSKELREKCYQQHVIHMSAATVLETNLSCDRLLVSLPALKWAEPVVQLGLQLANTCQSFIGQHYAAVIPTLTNMEPWNYPRIEEIMLNAANGLTIEQECSAYARSCSIIDKYKEEMSQTLCELMTKLKQHFEKRLLLKANKLGKCTAWNKMEAHLKTHIKSVVKFDDLHPKSVRNEPSRLPRMVSNRTGTSSSESSRNSSPATSQAHASPSLRRSLLLAARAPQVPPSPSTNRRISTLTLPTQASAAKSAPTRHIKQPSTTIPNHAKPRPNTAPQVPKKQPTKMNTSVRSIINVTKRESTIPTVDKRSTTTKVDTGNKRQTNVNHVKRNARSYHSQQPSDKGSTTTSKTTTKHKQPDKNKPAPAVNVKSPCMQRSSTFLKEEPTVLTHPDQNEL